MKTLNLILSVIIFISLVNIASAQTYTGNATDAINGLPNTSSQFNLIASQQNIKPQTISNSATVKQIGDYNTILSVTKSNSSDIQLTQIGNNNGIDLNVEANNINENVLQVGKDHTFLDYSGKSGQFHAANIYQLGANQNLILLGGQNSISNNMKVTMQGRNQTIIVRNLKN